MSTLSKSNRKKLNKSSGKNNAYVEILEFDDAFWQDVKLFLPSKKTQLSIRLDDEIISWFKQFGSGYQTKINAVLRSYINNIQKTKSKNSR